MRTSSLRMASCGRELLFGAALAALAHASVAQEVTTRRFEWVLTVRVKAKVQQSIGSAELAAARNGGAVLAASRIDSGRGYCDYRLLVRSLNAESIGPIISSIRAAQGVIDATAVRLPETATWLGGPSFIESYSAPDEDPISNAGRVVKRHALPPVADKRELLEATDVATGSGIPPLESLGGVGSAILNLNIDEAVHKLRAAKWRRREQKLRNTPIVILPPDP